MFPDDDNNKFKDEEPTEPTANGEDPLFSDNDNDIFEDEDICKQLDEAEMSNNNSKRRKSPRNIAGTPKPNENAVKPTPIEPATQTSESPTTINATSNENPEKRPRSLLDCLDDAYHKETPSKMKRESKSPTKRFPCSKPNTIVSFLDKSIQAAKNKNESIDEKSSPEFIDPESEPDCPLDENDVNSESIKEMGDGLESLHVVSQTSKDNSVDSVNVIPATSPSTKTHKSIDKGQTSLFDYFKKS